MLRFVRERGERAPVWQVFREMPVCVKSVQVDGGSEFRGEFEEVAKELVKICVLPARSPELNGIWWNA